MCIFLDERRPRRAKISRERNEGDLPSFPRMIRVDRSIVQNYAPLLLPRFFCLRIAHIVSLVGCNVFVLLMIMIMWLDHLAVWCDVCVRACVHLPPAKLEKWYRKRRELSNSHLILPPSLVQPGAYRFSSQNLLVKHFVFALPCLTWLTQGWLLIPRDY